MQPTGGAIFTGGVPFKRQVVQEYLVNEDKPFRVEIGLGLEPGPPAAQHVRTLLLAGVRRFS